MEARARARSATPTFRKTKTDSQASSREPSGASTKANVAAQLSRVSKEGVRIGRASSSESEPNADFWSSINQGSNRGVSGTGGSSATASSGGATREEIGTTSRQPAKTT